MTKYIAIFKTVTGDTFVIEYRPCYDEIAGGIEVLSVEHNKRPSSPLEKRRKYRRGLVLNEDDLQRERMQPYLWIESKF